MSASAAERLNLPTEVGATRTPLWAWGSTAIVLFVTWAIVYWMWRFGSLQPVPHLTLIKQVARYTTPPASTALIHLLWVVFGGVSLSTIAFHVTASFFAPIRKKDAAEALVDSSHMASIEEIRKAGLIDARCGDIIAYIPDPKTGEELVLRWNGGTGKIAIGRQGSGKSAAVAKPALLARAEHDGAKAWSEDERRAETYGWEPVRFVLAVKPDLVDSSAGFREQWGNVVVLDPFSRDPFAPKFNPLHLIRIGTPFMFGDCYRFGLAIIDQGEGLKDYWLRTAHEAIAAIIGHAAFASLHANDPTILSLPWITEFVSSFGNVDALCAYILAYHHDPHEVFGWTERKHGKPTGKKTRTCPWIASSIRALKGKEGPEKSGIYGSFLQFLALYRDPILAGNVSTSTFDVKDMANDRERTSTIYIRMPAPDLDRCRPYVRLLFSTFFHEVFRKTVTRGGREMRGNLRECIWDFDEAAQLDRMEQIERYAGLMRGLGGQMNTCWQNRGQIVKVYGKDETISGNQGVHFYFRPEVHDEAKPLSEALGKFSFVLQHRNLSGDRMALTKDHLAEQNQVQTRDHFTPFEVMNLAEDEVFIFCRGLRIRAKQFRYWENEAMLRRANIPWSGRSAQTLKTPKCITALERESGPEKLALLLSAAPDLYADHRDAATTLANKCRVFEWDETDDDTGMRSYHLQFWLPAPARYPIIDEAYPSFRMREKAQQGAIKVFDERDMAEPAKPAPKSGGGDHKEAIAAAIALQFAESDDIK